mmetsp:Transcript_20520/g.43091  ORF Transcript_20520/g.43091 Transcript_20520/m.43091 type:complete len:101 (-) Transcript_20520:125-427(-)
MFIVDTNFGCSRNATIHEAIVGAQPDAASPCSSPDYFAKAKLRYTSCKSFAVTRGMFVDEDNKMSTKSELLIPAKTAVRNVCASSFPIHPCSLLKHVKQP